MKASPSPLSILDFAITKMEFATIPPVKMQEMDVNTLFNKYDVELDFGIDVKDYIRVKMTATINNGPKQLPGYSMSLEVGCFFKFDDKIKLTPEQKNEIEGFSTIYIALNALRGILSSFTANAPFGRYILPSIDLNQLIVAKKAKMKEENEKTNMKTLKNKQKTAIKERSLKKKV